MDEEKKRFVAERTLALDTDGKSGEIVKLKEELESLKKALEKERKPALRISLPTRPVQQTTTTATSTSTTTTVAGSVAAVGVAPASTRVVTQPASADDPPAATSAEDPSRPTPEVWKWARSIRRLLCTSRSMWTHPGPRPGFPPAGDLWDYLLEYLEWPYWIPAELGGLAHPPNHGPPM